LGGGFGLSLLIRRSQPITDGTTTSKKGVSNLRNASLDPWSFIPLWSNLGWKGRRCSRLWSASGPTNDESRPGNLILDPNALTRQTSTRARLGKSADKSTIFTRRVLFRRGRRLEHYLPRSPTTFHPFLAPFLATLTKVCWPSCFSLPGTF